MTQKNTFRIVARSRDGLLQMRDYTEIASLSDHYEQIGVDDCSTDLALRGIPVFRGLIGPMPEDKNIVRYETPEVFEMLTKEWGMTKPKQRRTRTRKPDGASEIESAVAESLDSDPILT